MRVLVTGRTGQLVTSLVERGATRPGIEIMPIGKPQLDLESPGGAARAIKEARPDIVINAAAYTAVDQAEDEPERAARINAAGAAEVAAAAADLGAPVIQMSTDYVFDGASAEPYGEDAATNPLGVYGRSKLNGEEQVRGANPKHVIIRTAWVYSPFGKNFVKTIVALANQRDELTVVADQLGNPSSALDLADGLLALLELWDSGSAVGMGETYHLAGTGETSWFDFAAFIMSECEAHGAPSARVRPIRTEDWPVKAPRPRHTSLCSEKFALDVGFKMPEWQSSVRKSLLRLTA